MEIGAVRGWLCVLVFVSVVVLGGEVRRGLVWWL